MKIKIIIFLFIISCIPILLNAKSKFYVAMLRAEQNVMHSYDFPVGLFRYEGDTTWTHLGWPSTAVYGVSAFDKDMKYIFLSCGNGAMRSLDGGANWRITTDWRITEVGDVSINPANPLDVYIATAYGAWKSNDRGDTWTLASNGLKTTFVQTIEVDRNNEKRIISGGNSGLYLSTDGADNWTHVGPDSIEVIDVQQCRTKTEFWIAGSRTKGVLLSKDNGNSWNVANGKIAKESIYAVAIDPDNPQNMAAAGFDTGVYITTDSGKIWEQFKDGLPVLDIHSLIFDLEKSGRIWVGTLSAGVYYSDDLGKNWHSAGLTGGHIWDMTIVEE